VAAQGGLALVAAVLAGYMALALLGRAPAPELMLAGLTRHWTRRMHRLSGRLARQPGLLTRYVAGLLWGLLPCGLVLTALVVASVSGSAAYGAVTMLAFGLGTLPALLASGWLAGRAAASAHAALRSTSTARLAVAAVVLLFGTQMAFRGLAVWGVVGHLDVAGVMVW
jgi:sulfite exporter TauE/SafE